MLVKLNGIGAKQIKMVEINLKTNETQAHFKESGEIKRMKTLSYIPNVVQLHDVELVALTAATTNLLN